MGWQNEEIEKIEKNAKREKKIENKKAKIVEHELQGRESGG